MRRPSSFFALLLPSFPSPSRGAACSFTFATPPLRIAVSGESQHQAPPELLLHAHLHLPVWCSVLKQDITANIKYMYFNINYQIIVKALLIKA
jgi:hypothetical protein